MKPERAFVADRPIARHCAELLPAQQQAEDSEALLEAFGERLAVALAAGVSGLAGGEPKVRCSAPRADTLQDIALLAPRLAVWSLFEVDVPGAVVLASIDGAVVFQLVDLAFGGTGALPEALPDAFPLSADLLIARIEAMVEAAIADAMGCAESRFRQLARQTDPGRLEGLASDEALTVLDFEIRAADQRAWKLMLAFSPPARAIFAGNQPAATATSGQRRTAADPVVEPFGGLPLSVRAVLVDMRIGFSRLSGLRPGDILPVAVARKVPLRIGEQTIAHGTIGEMDDRVAVQVTQAF